MIEILGLIGGACFAFAAVPSALATIKAGHSIGVPVSLAWLVFTGTITVFAYLYIKYGLDWILLFNYTVEACSWAVILFYHYFRGRPNV